MIANLPIHDTTHPDPWLQSSNPLLRELALRQRIDDLERAIADGVIPLFGQLRAWFYQDRIYNSVLQARLGELMRLEAWRQHSIRHWGGDFTDAMAGQARDRGSHTTRVRVTI